MDAKQARTITMKSMDVGLSEKQIKYLKRIEEAAPYHYQISFSEVLPTEDVKFFQARGFVVVNAEWETWEGSHGREHESLKDGKISWEKPKPKRKTRARN